LKQKPLEVQNIYNDYINTAKLLLENGADAIRKNKDGDTPLALAMSTNPTHDSIIKLLQEHLSSK